jgi:hypothetical protein
VFQPVDVDVEAAAGDETLVALGQAPRELPHRRVDAALALEEAARAQHRLEVGGDRAADVMIVQKKNVVKSGIHTLRSHSGCLAIDHRWNRYQKIPVTW